MKNPLNLAKLPKQSWKFLFQRYQLAHSGRRVLILVIRVSTPQLSEVSASQVPQNKFKSNFSCCQRLRNISVVEGSGSVPTADSAVSRLPMRNLADVRGSPSPISLQTKFSGRKFGSPPLQFRREPWKLPPRPDVSSRLLSSMTLSPRAASHKSLPTSALVQR